MPQFAIMYLTIAIIVISVHYIYAFLLVRAQRRFSGMFSSRLFPGLSAAIFLFWESRWGLCVSLANDRRGESLEVSDEPGPITCSDARPG